MEPVEMEQPMVSMVSSTDETASVPIVSPFPLVDGFRSGYVAIVGRPNVGKSTLLNRLLGEKVAIATSRVQTTRTRIRGVLTLPDTDDVSVARTAQVVFLDTPGFSKPLDKLGEVLTAEAHAALSDADAVLFVVDGATILGAGDEWLAGQIQATGKPVVMLFNKIDRFASNQEQTKRAQAYFNLFKGYQAPFTPLVASAKTGRHVRKVVETLLPYLPEQPPFYDSDTYTDQHLRDLALELIREKVMQFTGDELPHAVAVVLDAFDESQHPKLTRISATLYVEKLSQKGMIIGKGGAMIKRIGQAARQDIEPLLDTPLYLDLQVKVKLNWRKDTRFLQRMGYDVVP